MFSTIKVIIYTLLACSGLQIFASGAPKAANTPSPECIRRCRSCPPTPACAPGVSLVVDDCGCCKTCAKQIGEACDDQMKCDHHKGLYCSYNDVDDEGRRCVAMPGRSCDFGGQIYGNGETFTHGCKAVCTCINGYVGCSPQCPIDITANMPKNCLHPKLVKKPGKCCEEWICVANRLNNTTATNRRNTISQPRLRTEARPIRQRTRFLPAERPTPVTVRIRPRDKCQIQTTEWSPCSKTCGWGISERVITDKKCKLRKQSRLCQLRPCNVELVTKKKKAKKCTRTVKSQRRVRFSFSGCHSKVYAPKYCGTCTDGKCCSPKQTVTKSVKFSCDDGSRFRKRMMIIKSCECKRKCSKSLNEILFPNRRMGEDTWRE